MYEDVTAISNRMPTVRVQNFDFPFAISLVPLSIVNTVGQADMFVQLMSIAEFGEVSSDLRGACVHRRPVVLRLERVCIVVRGNVASTALVFCQS
jgi:hypothetical protein